MAYTSCSGSFVRSGYTGFPTSSESLPYAAQPGANGYVWANTAVYSLRYYNKTLDSARSSYRYWGYSLRCLAIE